MSLASLLYGSLSRAIPVAALAVRHPIEFLDRIAGRLERAVDPGLETRLTGARDWSARLHQALGIPNSSCHCMGEFRAAWDALVQVDPGVGRGHDGDPVLAGTCFVLARHLEPTRIVETGVARGVTTRFLLSAAPEAILYSIDLPPMDPRWAGQSCSLVPQGMRDRWRYVRGASRRILPRLTAKIGSLDLFVHDSSHTRRTVLFECESAWTHLRPGGAIVVDDADKSRGFLDFVERTCVGIRTHTWGLLEDELKAGLVGFVLKGQT